MEAAEKAKIEAENKLKELEDGKAAVQKELEETTQKMKRLQAAAGHFKKRAEQLAEQIKTSKESTTVATGGSGPSTPAATTPAPEVSV